MQDLRLGIRALATPIVTAVAIMALVTQISTVDQCDLRAER
jgi:hypothetical protein